MLKSDDGFCLGPVILMQRCVVFFLQAEDSIRDFHVTGVQTCALPILAEEIYRPVRTFLEHKDYTTAIDINPHYITPKMLQFRLQKIMDEYVAGVATYYTTNEHMQIGRACVGKERTAQLEADGLRTRQK